MVDCNCQKELHDTKLIVITGGPGAGKTATLEMARKHFCDHISILPEAATIIFQGGFYRNKSTYVRMAAQRAIFHVQTELEKVILEEGKSALALCDRGTIDGLAYWPGEEKGYWSDVGSTLEAELSKYTAVIHLKTPSLSQGYNHQNPFRIESQVEAAIIDRKISLAWQKHPNVFEIESETDFVTKVTKTLEIIRQFVPQCCKD